MKKIPYGKQTVDDSDIDTIVDVLRSDWLTQGPKVPQFEREIARYCGASYSVATNSATSALHVACLALGVGEGDSVWTSANTFVASANCALYCGATVDFVDIDKRTANICPEKLEEKLRVAEVAGKLPKVVIPVHFAGQSCDAKKIWELSKRYGFSVIEDASHALGATYENSKVGSCKYCDVTVFSFHPVKIITTGEGGVAVTNDSSLCDLMRAYRSHGITSESDKMELRSASQVWNYQQILLGYNYRMSDLHAALGLCQLQKADAFVAARRRIASRYYESFVALSIPTLVQDLDFSSFHLFQIKARDLGVDQKHLYDYLRANGVLVNIHYIPVYMHPYYQKLGFRQGYCPEAERHFSECLSLPIYFELSDVEQSYVLDLIRAGLDT